MANTILTPSIIAREALMQLINNMVMGNLVHRDYKREFVKIGDTVTIRKPVKFLVTDGATRSNQDVTEQSTSLVIDKRKHVSWNFDSESLTLEIEQYSERYIKPAMIALANQVDSDLCGLYKELYMHSGTAGNDPGSFLALAQAAQKLDEGAVPRDQRRLVLNPAGFWSLADAIKGVQNETIVKDVLREARFGRIANFDIFMDQNIKSHTSGSDAGGGLVNGASQTGTSLITDDWTASQTGILLEGDVITLAGVNAVNPWSKEDTGSLMQFRVTADADSDGTGDSTISISPGITTSGPYQNVTGSPADNAAITLVGDHTANLAFHRNALALVNVPIQMPDGVWGFQENFRGVNIRIVKDYDIDNDVEIIRCDILYGVAAIYPELGTRVSGNA